MTVGGTDPMLSSWAVPGGLRHRGTVLVLPGRGGHTAVRAHVDRRIAARRALCRGAAAGPVRVPVARSGWTGPAT